MAVDLATIFAAFGGSVVTLVGAVLMLPKVRAEARKINAEASGAEWRTLKQEIDRLQERVEAQDRRIAELEKLDDERADREAGLEKENRQLRAKVKKLEGRIAGLEAVLKVGPLPAAMRAALAKLRDVE
jgi:chromosome segregation ATPase